MRIQNASRNFRSQSKPHGATLHVAKQIWSGAKQLHKTKQQTSVSLPCCFTSAFSRHFIFSRRNLATSCRYLGTQCHAFATKLRRCEMAAFGHDPVISFMSLFRIFFSLPRSIASQSRNGTASLQFAVSHCIIKEGNVRRSGLLSLPL
jgi:hypothetical protein